MKYLLPGMIFLLVFVYACKKEENLKLEATVNQAYAFDIGSAWEVNISTKVKGFKQDENNGKFKSSLSINIDLVKPGGETVKGLINKTEGKIDKEKIPDMILDSQFDLDSTYVPGKYKAVVNIKDMVSGNTTTTIADVDLTK
jgi:hypothetical protein